MTGHLTGTGDLLSRPFFGVHQKPWTFAVLEWLAGILSGLLSYEGASYFSITAF